LLYIGDPNAVLPISDIRGKNGGGRSLVIKPNGGGALATSIDIGDVLSNIVVTFGSSTAVYIDGEQKYTSATGASFASIHKNTVLRIGTDISNALDRVELQSLDIFDSEKTGMEAGAL